MLSLNNVRGLPFGEGRGEGVPPRDPPGCSTGDVLMVEGQVGPEPLDRLLPLPCGTHRKERGLGARGARLGSPEAPWLERQAPQRAGCRASLSAEGRGANTREFGPWDLHRPGPGPYVLCSSQRGWGLAPSWGRWGWAGLRGKPSAVRTLMALFLFLPQGHSEPYSGRTTVPAQGGCTGCLQKTSPESHPQLRRGPWTGRLCRCAGCLHRHLRTG